ncbi:hypothetical protein A2617_01905 [Candidatus Daviesbacteria bacterium RIFOXYD1_FULL_41_10]|uniref:O-antigen ligase-related domain-containing protein n=2 Tax=Candidatus Daviesiibacteriota TaxID=1752718 RepID=A0A1F5N0V8_9BACT|nr:MAG: Tetratricopeptide repeat domain protein [Candidatus Daviesbacteria bacterium GW2011_GWB1_41_5]OGE71258.1 MAG: hypothetical protein A2617_01905 [Candidatus Daviesbacteria bacterium RIFOXYD1_FULL_41_10]
MLQKILTFSFYLLFAITPLLWAPWSFELFEYNKMMFVYFLTIIIAGTWFLKIINQKSLIINRTPLDIPILIFLGANILSTIFSIDTHTSLWGYYSRLNGGLLSTISYTLLYFALVSNFDLAQIIKFLKAALWGGLVVSLWAIPEHFGVSPSCILLGGEANASCWVQDVQSRVFATLGQPNWLAAYLTMLIFPTFYFILTAPSKLYAIRYTLYAILLYLAFTFTYSRGGALGFLAGLAVFIPCVLWLHPGGGSLKRMALVLTSFLIINILFGSALTSFKLLSKFAPVARPAINLSTAVSRPGGTQLENGGGESGQIRLIVWRGAWEIFKAYPILGSGVETFAYSYYRYRPSEHNLTSEWDFLYNKAHNEFLNYLATTGIVGFGAYMAVICLFIFFCIKYYVLSIKGKSKTRYTLYPILIPSLLAAYIGNLVQSFFGFSTVNTALFFFLFPALAFVSTSSTQPYKLLYFNRFAKFFRMVIIILSVFLAFTIIKNYQADTLFAEGSKSEDTSPGRAYNDISSAIALNSGEPFYQSELGYAAAAASASVSSEDASLSGKLKDQAARITEKVLGEHPNNVSYFRTAIRIYYLLATADPAFNRKTLDIFDKALTLAPTDAKLYYNKGVVLDNIGRRNEAILAIQKSLDLKPNYLDAKDALNKLKTKD